MPLDLESLTLFELFQVYTKAWSAMDNITLNLAPIEYNKRFREMTGMDFNDAYMQYLDRYWAEH